MNDDNKCSKCGKYSGGATLCNACQKKALKKPKPKGTPKSLIEAIQDALRPLLDAHFEVESQSTISQEVHSAVKDFLSQKFQVTLLWAATEDPVTEAKILQLFREITK